MYTPCPGTRSTCHSLSPTYPPTHSHPQEAGTEGRPDAELAVEAWTNYRARNDSAIVDHFQVGGCGGWVELVGCGWLWWVWWWRREK